MNWYLKLKSSETIENWTGFPAVYNWIDATVYIKTISDDQELCGLNRCKWNKAEISQFKSSLKSY